MRDNNTESAEPVGLRMRPSLKKRLDVAAAERGEPLYEILQEALERYLTDGAGRASIPAKFRPRVDQLLDILENGDEGIVKAITSNLTSFQKAVRALRALEEHGIKL